MTMMLVTVVSLSMQTMMATGSATRNASVVVEQTCVNFLCSDRCNSTNFYQDQCYPIDQAHSTKLFCLMKDDRGLAAGDEDEIVMMIWQGQGCQGDLFQLSVQVKSCRGPDMNHLFTSLQDFGGYRSRNNTVGLVSQCGR
eukprot:gene6701-1197_t